MRRGAPLELIRTKEGHVGNGKIKVSLGCSDQEMVAYEIRRATRRAHCTFTTLDFRRTDFGLFKDLLRRALWDVALERSGPQESWLEFKDHLLQAQEQPIPTARKPGKNARGPAWMIEELLAKLKHKKEAYGGWEQGRVTWEEHGSIA